MPVESAEAAGCFSATFVLAVGLLALPAVAAGAPLSTGDGGWVWQNPLPQGNTLNSVRLCRCQPRLGRGRTTARSSPPPMAAPPGARRAHPPAPAELGGVAFADASHGWVVGVDGNGNAVILATTDGGAHWSPQSTPSGNDYLSAVSFSGASHGWAVGTGRQRDRASSSPRPTAGATGAPQSVPAGTSSLNAVDLHDATHGWAMGSDQKRQRRHPRHDRRRRALGHAEPAFRTGDLNAVAFADASHGWAGSDGSGMIVATTDGGADWHSAGHAFEHRPTGVSFADASHGWAAGIRTTPAIP